MESSSAFQYKRRISAIVGEKGAVVLPYNSSYCVLAACGTFYTLYDIEKLNVIGRGEEVTEIACMAMVGRYVVVGGRDKFLYVFSEGRVVAKTCLGEVPREIVAAGRILAVQGKDRIYRIEIEGSDMNGGGEDGSVGGDDLDNGNGGDGDNGDDVNSGDGDADNGDGNGIGNKNHNRHNHNHRNHNHHNHGKRRSRKHRNQQNHDNRTHPRVQITKKTLPGKEMENITTIQKYTDKKILIAAGRSIIVYNIADEKIVYRTKCADLQEVRALSLSISRDIVAAVTPKEVCIINIKKDAVLQRIDIPGAVAADFRKNVVSKELAVLTAQGVSLVDLETGAVKKKIAAEGGVSLQYVGGEQYIVMALNNELRILDSKNSLALVKKRSGVKFGSASDSALVDGALYISTNSTVYSVSLRKEEQLKEISDVAGGGEVVSISARRKRVLACFERRVFSLVNTVGGLAKQKKNLTSQRASRKYVGAVASLCGNVSAISVENGERKIKTLIVSTESGFIFGEVEQEAYLAISISTDPREIVAVHRDSVSRFSYSGSLISRAEIPEIETAQIAESRTGKFVVGAGRAALYVFNPNGEIMRKITTEEGPPAKIEFTKDLKWISTLKTGEKKGVFSVFDVETGKRVSSTVFSGVDMPRRCHITDDKTQMVAVTKSGILLYSNASVMNASAHSEEKEKHSGISFSSLHRARARLLLEYSDACRKTESETKTELFPYPVISKENFPGAINSSSQSLSPCELVAALLDRNQPISSIIEAIKSAPSPGLLISGLLPYLGTEYDLADALINRTIHYRRKDLAIDEIEESLRIREKTSERFVSLYLSVLSLAK